MSQQRNIQVINLDSITLALTKPLKELVKPEFTDKWENELYPKWFVHDANDVNQSREPGLFKEEVNITSGGMVALRKLSIYVQKLNF